MPSSSRSPRNVLLRELLVEQRKAMGLTQEDVAQRLSKPQSFVAKYEGGERRLDVVEFLDVVSAIRADPVEIIRSLIRATASRSATS